MTRTVVPPPLVPKIGPDGKQERGDDLPTKLVKYVPAETLAFFVPTAAAIGKGRDGLLLLVVAAGAIGTFGYLWYRAQAEPSEKRPLAHFYVLSVIAFFVWAVGTAPNVAALARLDSIAAGVVLGLGVFLIPLTDNVLTELHRKRSP